MSYQPLQDVYLNFDIVMSFRPEATDGMLMYNGQYNTGIGDFMCFGLNGAYPEFRFDVGSGPAIIRGNNPVQMNTWNTVQFKRDRKNGSEEIQYHIYYSPTTNYFVYLHTSLIFPKQAGNIFFLF